MSADLLARLIEAGTPATLVAEVAMLVARADAAGDALEQRRASERANSARYRARGGDQIPGWMRRAVFERDRYACVDCSAEDRLECDHVTPLAKGGPTALDNLQTLCKSCNARKRDRIRKSDERGQTRTNPDRAGMKGETADEPAPAPSPLPSPCTPNLPHAPTPTREDTPARMRKAAAWPCPDGVDPAHWADLIANRKSKRLANTPTALTGILRDLAKHSDDEWPPGRIVQHAAERGWGAIFDPRPKIENRNAKHRGHREPASRPVDGFTSALRRASAKLEAGNLG